MKNLSPFWSDFLYEMYKGFLFSLLILFIYYIIK